jgi:peptide/nickel transport system substrate-binding protein
MTRLSAMIAALAIGVTAAISGPVAAENVLRWASAGGALTVDPHAYNEVPTFAQLNQVYEKLLDLDSNLNLVPMLAVAWRLVEPTIWEFDLRPNVRFHDGAPFTAADVVFSIARAKTELPIGFASYTDSIDQVQAIGQYEVRIRTKFPDPQLDLKLSSICIMSKSWAEAHDARVPVNVSAGEENYASRHANGTGPFILKEFEPNGRVVMARNPNWWGLERYPHNIDRIEFTPIADPQERLAALLRGDLDLLTDPPFAALDRIKSTPGLKLEEAPELRTIWLGMDQGSGELRSSNVKGKNPFKDRRVRRAIYQAIDIEAIRRDIMRGLSLPAGMLVAPGAIGYAPELDQRLPYDPERPSGCSRRPGIRGASASPSTARTIAGSTMRRSAGRSPRNWARSASTSPPTRSPRRCSSPSSTIVRPISSSTAGQRSTPRRSSSGSIGRARRTRSATPTRRSTRSSTRSTARGSPTAATP